ncbi:MAG: ribonucleotide reductase subunit alpha [Rhizobacter sp.]|nr:ribonucleotide reductase subunit alpha [Rhizobacter sp.]
MSLTTFDDLLSAARQQPQPQRLLFVFAAAELPDDATPAQHAAFAAGHGGALAPLMCADKTPDELAGFDDLVQESAQFGQPWAIVFVAGLAGDQGQAPTSAQADAPLQRMVEAIKAGRIEHYLPFNRDGRAVSLR